MEIVPFEPGMAEAVARRYNDLIEPVPECYSVSADRFSDLTALAPRKSDRVRDERLMVARCADGEVAGFVHVGIGTPTKHDHFMHGDAPAIRFLAHRPGERAVGQALIEWAEGWGRERGFGEVCAWVSGWRYRFYHFPCAHLSERMGHVRALFGMNGYEVVDAELYLTWYDFRPPEPKHPSFDVDLSTAQVEGNFGPALEVTATVAGEQAGVCRMDRGQASPGPESAQWCFCDNLWVADRLQGKRLGMYLLSAALKEMHEAGCRHAAISASGPNYRAHLFYTNLGYQVADHTVAFRKGLRDAGSRSGG